MAKSFITFRLEGTTGVEIGREIKMNYPSEPNPYWIDTTGLTVALSGDLPRMGIIPCPPGGEHLVPALLALRAQGIESLVSLLQPSEARVFGLEGEAEAARHAGINYSSLPVTDHSIPDSVPEFRRVVDRLHEDLRSGKAVGAHCFAGIGRSCMLMACLLCLEGLQPDEAFARLSAARGLRVPDTWLQSRWVEHFAGSLASAPKAGAT
jgi:protein-tyrosine phosphatase